jgi:hypothetical protein
MNADISPGWAVAVVLVGAVLASVVAGGALAQSTDVEPNPNRSQAQSVEPGTTIRGDISSVDERDWFALNATDDQQVVIDFTTIQSNGTLGAVYYYDPPAWKASFSSVNDSKRIVKPTNGSGTYFIQVGSADDTGEQGVGDYTGQYRMTVETIGVNETPGPTPTTGPTPTVGATTGSAPDAAGTGTGAGAGTESTETGAGDSSAFGPGFGVLGAFAALAVLAAALFVRLRSG